MHKNQSLLDAGTHLCYADKEHLVSTATQCQTDLWLFYYFFPPLSSPPPEFRGGKSTFWGGKRGGTPGRKEAQPMKRIFAMAAPVLCLLLTGCGPVGSKGGTVSLIYGAVTLLSVLMLAGYCFFIKKKDPWFLLLFSAVVVVDAGYLALSLSDTLAQALMANRVSYLGATLLPFAMLNIILNVSDLRRPRWVIPLLMAANVLVFLVAASPGYLDIYYKEVTLATVGGITVLRKVYGPWHSLYLFFLVGYFLSMLIVIVYAQRKKTLRSPSHVAILFSAVGVNIAVWLLEQLVHTDFELLSISYLVSELFLLSLYLMLQELHTAAPAQPVEASAAPPQPSVDADRCDYLHRHLPELTPTERMVYDLYLQGKSPAQVLEELNITQNTLKYHNRNIYSKLGVANRKELVTLALQAPTRP